MEKTHFGGFWVRVFAAVLDCLFLGMILELLHFLFTALFGEQGTIPKVMLSPIADQVYVLFYFVLFHASAMQATPGKRLLNVYVATAEGKRLSYFLALYRYLVAFILPWAPLLTVVLLNLPTLQEVEVIGAYLQALEDERVTFEQFSEVMTTYGYMSRLTYAFFAGAAGLVLQGIWVLAIPLTDEKTAVHDMICNTRVVYGREGKAW